MKKIITLRHLLLNLLLIAALSGHYGCGKAEKPAKPKPEIREVCGVKFGEKHDPRNGEGKLLDINHRRPDLPHFSKISVEVTPFEHNVWRIVLIAPEIPGNEPLKVAAGVLSKRFEINFSARGENLVADLPQQQVVLRRRLDWGPRACEAEFICKKGANIAAQAKKSPRFREAYNQEKAFNDLVVLLDLAEAYKQQTGQYPRQLEELRSIAGTTPIPQLDPWGKPYRMEINAGKISIKASRQIQ